MIRIYLERFKQNRLAMAGFAFIAGLTALALLAPWLAPRDPLAQDLLQRLQGPSPLHWLGTDDLGRDVLARLLIGTRVSLSVGLVAVGLELVIGVSLGLCAGYFGGKVDAAVMRLVDVMLSIPTIFLILAVLAFLGPSIYNVMILIGLTSWPGLTRLVRGECLSIREREYIQAARIAGISTGRLLFVHLLPNVVAPIIVSATLAVGGAILTESALSFLGLGVQPPAPSWGNILSIGRDYLHIAWWLSVFPASAILLTVLAFNLLGEGLRDVLDPPNLMLEIENLSVDYVRRGQVIHAVRDLSLAVGPGETVGLVGESGSGKSTVALSILRLIRPQEGTIVSGRILYKGEDLLTLSEERLQAVRGKRISMIFQDPFTALNPVMRVREQMEEISSGLRSQGSEIGEALLRVQLEPARVLASYPHQLSGGQRQRVMIAMALLAKPDFVLADEPTTALDVLVQKEILDLLFTLQKELGMGMLFITHNLGLVARHARRLVVMKDGVKVEEGPTDAMFKEPRHPYTRELLTAMHHVIDIFDP